MTVRDGHPVAPGHTLIIPKRHFASFFDATEEELSALLGALRSAKDRLDRDHSPDGYNVGINQGLAAGQTVMHLHIHLIPRYQGDVADPRGGVRHLIPGKGNYLDETAS
jgi:diadenosine tetraphosphate (Ap4A) HIT family hydrolase